MVGHVIDQLWFAKPDISLFSYRSLIAKEDSIFTPQKLITLATITLDVVTLCTDTSVPVLNSLLKYSLEVHFFNKVVKHHLQLHLDILFVFRMAPFIIFCFEYRKGSYSWTKSGL